MIRRNSGAAVGIAVLAVILLASVALPLPYSPTRPDPMAITAAPGHGHIFGTDGNGFDVFSRTVASAKRDLPLALLGTLFAVLIGVPLGLAAASLKRGGQALMRVVDAFAALPMIMIAVVAVQLVGGGLINIMLALMVVNVPRFIRLMYGEALALRASRFVEAAVAMGCSPIRVAFNHIFRNAYGIILVQASVTAANSVVVIAAMSFLGIGVAPPTPTWGSMIQDGAVAMVQGKWWVVCFPALAVFVAVASLNLIAENIEKRLDGTRGRA
jgi:peptide/nickel transport system permease protein